MWRNVFLSDKTQFDFSILPYLQSVICEGTNNAHRLKDVEMYFLNGKREAGQS